MVFEFQHKRVVIIGAGVGGVMMGIALRRRYPGYTNFVIYEKGADIGGTWRDNTYPGCSSDSGIHFYSLSTDLNPNWSSTHGSQQDIHEYWRSLCYKYDLYNRIQFNTTVTAATYNAESTQWTIDTQDVNAVSHVDTANVLISAHGILEIPRFPDIPGLETFEGVKFHSGKYRRDVPLGGKNVGVIGNGATATQMVPMLTEDPTVTVVNFCRTPNWFLPPIRSKYSKRMIWAFNNVPLFMRLTRLKQFLMGDFLYFSVFGTRFLHPMLVNAGKQYIRNTAPERYHDKLTPPYTLGCRRLIFDTNYLAALHRPNLSLIWDGVESIYKEGVITTKGEKLKFDVLIFSTGFVADDFPFPVKANNTTLKKYYEKSAGPKAYLGTTVPGFPNFCLIGGPNTTTGHTSVIYTEEIQAGYVLQLLEPIFAGHLESFDVTHAATDSYNEKIHGRLDRSVFMSCMSWYRVGRTGKVSSIFPAAATLFWWWLRRVNWDHYTVSGSQDQMKRWSGLRKKERYSWRGVADGLFVLVVERLLSFALMLIAGWKSTTALLTGSRTPVSKVRLEKI